MRIIMLGSTGYLGSRLTAQLAGEGHEVLCLKRPQSSLDALEPVADHVQFCDIDALPAWLAGHPPYDCLLNAACKYPRNAASEKDIFQANLFVPLQVFLDCLAHNVQRYITIGTGLPDDFNAYAVSKKALADLMRWYGTRHQAIGLPLCICNVKLENFYGEDEPEDRFLPGTIAKLRRNEDVLLTSGEQKRDFIYIGDVVAGIAKLVRHTELPAYLDFPLGTGENVSIRALVEYLKEITGSRSHLRFGAVEKRMHEPDSIADCTQMQKYGVCPKYGWQEGIKKTVQEQMSFQTFRTTCDFVYDPHTRSNITKLIQRGGKVTPGLLPLFGFSKPAQQHGTPVACLQPGGKLCA